MHGYNERDLAPVLDELAATAAGFCDEADHSDEQDWERVTPDCPASSAPHAASRSKPRTRASTTSATFTESAAPASEPTDGRPMHPVRTARSTAADNPTTQPYYI
jgi:hypothetical protein